MEFEGNVYFSSRGRDRGFWRDVTLSRIEVEKPTVILYITFGIVFILAIIFGVSKARGAKRNCRQKFNVNFLLRFFAVVYSLNLAKNLRSKFDLFTLFCYFKRNMKFTKKEKNDQISKVEI